MSPRDGAIAKSLSVRDSLSGPTPAAAATNPVPAVMNWEEMPASVGILYEKLRYERMYGALSGRTEPKEALPRAFLARVRALAENFPRDAFCVRATFFHLGGEVGGRIVPQKVLGKAAQAMAAGAATRVDSQSRDAVSIMAQCLGLSLVQVVGALGPAHVVIIVPAAGEFGDLALGVHSAQPNLAPFEAAIRQQYPAASWTLKEFPRTLIHLPQTGDLEALVPYIFPWLEGKQATLLRLTGSIPNEVQFYRHSASKDGHVPLEFGTPPVLENEVSRGAFAFVPDSTREVGGAIGPDVVTVDIDPRRGTSYHSIRARALEYVTFLASMVGVEVHLAHSGNRSFHARIFVGRLPGHLDRDAWGYILPRAVTWDTFHRRRAGEWEVTTITDAAEIVTMAYSDESAIGPVRFRGGDRWLEFFFDNRTGVHTGARVPGSFHHLSGRLCRNFTPEQVPRTASELAEVTDPTYVLRAVNAGDEDIICLPSISSKTREQNTRALLDFTRAYMEKHHALLLEGGDGIPGGDGQPRRWEAR